MAESSNQNKYDSLLNQFFNNDNKVAEEESDKMKQWLEEATNRLRSEFQVHRGTDGRFKNDTNKIRLSTSYSDEVEAAMCVSLPGDFSDEEDICERKTIKKRSCDNDMFDSDTPSAKRFGADQSFLKDFLDLNMISISSGLTHKTINEQEANVALQISPVSICPLNSNGFELDSEEKKKVSVISKQICGNKSSNYSNINTTTISEPVNVVKSGNSSCIWPVGVSHQPDFIEIVVTDAEMNAYWDTIQDFF